LSDIDIYRMHQTADKDLWFVGEGGAIRYAPETGDLRRFEWGPDAIPAWGVNDIIEDEDGLWLGTQGGGVGFYDGTSWETWATDDELGGNRTDGILQDGAGTLWFSHGDGNGLSRYDPASDTWQTFGEDEGALDWPSYPGVDSEGYLWVGDYGELKRYDGRTWQRFAPAQLADVTVYHIVFSLNDVQWLWTDAGLLRHDPTADEWATFTAADHPVLEDVYTLRAASDGTLWVGSEAGLIHYDGSDWSTPATSGTPPGPVSDIAEAPDGSLWVAADGTLYHLDDDQWTQVSHPDDEWIERVTVGPEGHVWAGYDSLGHFDPSRREWQTFTTTNGLVHHQVEAIYVTPEGVVWVGTRGGASRYTPGE
jgi:ligand-binding sensor domain-containing protein